MSSNRCKQLIALLTSQMHHSLADTQVSHQQASVSSFSGIILSSLFLDSSLNSNSWILDSGATHTHVCCNKNCFLPNTIVSYDSTVFLPNGNAAKIDFVGTFKIFGYLILEKVLFIQVLSLI